MTRFMVFEPPPEETRGPRPAPGASDRAVFVRDAFSLWGFLVPPLWLLRHGLLFRALAAILAIAGLGALFATGRALVALPILFCLGLVVALEGPEWRARRLLRRRWRDAGAVEAADAGEAAILYFAGNDAARTAEGRAVVGLPWTFEPVAAAPVGRRRWRPFGGKARSS